MHESDTAKRVPKISTKAKAALEAKAAQEATASKKRKAGSNGLGDSTKTQPKKAKTNPPAGGTLTSEEMVHKKVATSSKDSSASRCASVMREEEENALHAGSTIIHVGLDGSETESQAGGEAPQEDTSNPSAEEDAEAELARLTKDWTAPIYSFFNPIPVIGHING
ncbi:hypothetical protein DFH29DRAFT_993961 [Suillus ampliporus]|nr:hypothetical protein DFH29DRAFT_993961 [Suillus ampliporus]